MVAGRSGAGVGLVVEDVHWADSETLDFLTFLARPGRPGPVGVVVTCRGDEAPLAEHVAGWLARVRADAGVAEIRLGPLSRAQVAGQVAAACSPASGVAVTGVTRGGRRGPSGRGTPGPGGRGRSGRAGVRLRQAAAHWQRVIELAEAQPGAAAAAGIDVPRLSVRAIDAFFRAGDSARAGLAAEEAYRRFVGQPDPATAAVLCHRAAYFRASDAPDAGLPLMEEALRLFEQAPPSFDHADALLDYATIFLLFAAGRLQASRTALDRALEIAEAVGATALIPRVLASLAAVAFVRGQVEEGFAALERGWALARASRDGPALVWLAVNESDALLKLGQFQRAADVASRGLDDARQAGLQSWEIAGVVAAFAAEALLALGRTAEAAALIDPLTTTPPDRDHWLAHVNRAEIDLLRGDYSAAARRWQLIYAFPVHRSRVDFAYESAPRAAEAWLWAGRPGDALRETRRALALFQVPDLTILCGRLLAAGMRACADLAEQARARRDQFAAATPRPSLTTWPPGSSRWAAPRSPTTPRGHHPGRARHLGRGADPGGGRSDPDAWGGTAKAWQDLGCPHRAGYAWWRQAEAQLDAALPAARRRRLRAAAAAAGGHAPSWQKRP